MQQWGYPLIFMGLFIAAFGWLLRSGWGDRLHIGRLPGDIYINTDRIRFYFPIVTCLLLSVIISALVWLFRR